MATGLFRPLPAPDPPLTDGTLLRRLPREADAAAIAATCGDPEIPRWIPIPVPARIEGARTPSRSPPRVGRTDASRPS